MNKVKNALELLGLKVNEEFHVNGGRYTYLVNDIGNVFCKNEQGLLLTTHITLSQLLAGVYEVTKAEKEAETDDVKDFLKDLKRECTRTVTCTDCKYYEDADSSTGCMFDFLEYMDIDKITKAYRG